MVARTSASRGMVVACRIVVAAGAGLAAAGFGVAVAYGQLAEAWLDVGAAFTAAIAVFLAAFVWVVISQQPRNRVLWVLALVVFGAGYYAAVNGFVSSIEPGVEIVISGMAPADVPEAAARLVGAAVWTWIPTWFTLLTFGLLLFPDGELPSPRWRIVGIAAATGIAISTAVEVWRTRPVSDEPYMHLLYGQGTLRAAGFVGFALIFAAVVASVISLVVRYRRASGITRQQLKWIAWGAAALGPMMVVESALLQSSSFARLALIPFAAALFVFFGAYSIAVARYRLYDVDIVISRTLVYGALALFISIVYVAIVVGVGALFGRAAEPNPVLAIVAAAVIAIGFQPLRRRLQQFANRVVYGRRYTPYEVLADFSNRVRASDDALLTDAAQSLVEGTGASEAAVWLGSGDQMQRTAVWPPDAGEAPTPLLAADDDGRAVFPVEHRGQLLGALILTPPRGQVLDAGDRRLAGELAGAMGLTLGNQQLTETLLNRVAELRTSRRQLVSVQDETRRRLERDLHDGAQQQIVAMKVKLGLARQLAGRDGAEQTAKALASLIADADHAVESMRDFARGVYPPLLESEGLAVVLEALVRKAPATVTLHTVGLGRYPRDIESTIYFCVVEALGNALRHAAADSVHVTVIDRGGTIRFEVTDDGTGFDREGVVGAGLTTMTDRLDIAEGVLEVRSAVGGGTAVIGSVPVPSPDPRLTDLVGASRHA